MNGIWLPNMTLRDVECAAIAQALAYFGGNKMQTAVALDISLGTLRNKIRLYDELAHYRVPPRSVKPSRLRKGFQ